MICFINSTLLYVIFSILGSICVWIESYFALFMLFSVAHYSLLGLTIQSQLTQVLLFLVALMYVRQPLVFIGFIIRQILCLEI